jgi:hypothetical protein
MSVTPSPIAGFAGQFFDNNGVILSGGKIYTYAAGTTTPQASYTSATGVTPHSNPIILDSAGRVPGGEIWLTDSLIYKFVIETSTNVLIGTYDNITGVNSNFVNYTVQEEVITAAAGQTVFNLTTVNYTPGTNSLSVYIDGVNQYVGDSYLETDSDTVTFTAGLHVGAEVKFTTAIQVTTNTIDAENVSYDPPFANSVPTNVEAKLSEYVSVKDFGAVGDGVADDTAAIQAAIASGQPIYFPKPASFYNIASAINITVPFSAGLYRVFGGAGAVTLNAPAYPDWFGTGVDGSTGGAAFNKAALAGTSVRLADKLYNIRDVRLVSGVSIYGDGSNSRLNLVADISTATPPVFADAFLTVTNNKAAPLDFHNFQLTTLTANGAVLANVFLLYEVDNVSIFNVRIRNTCVTVGGIGMLRVTGPVGNDSNSSRVKIIGCDIESTEVAEGIGLTGVIGCEITSNRVYIIDDDAIGLHGAIADQAPYYNGDISITGNTVYAGSRCILLDGLNLNINASGNVFVDIGTVTHFMFLTQNPFAVVDANNIPKKVLLADNVFVGTSTTYESSAIGLTCGDEITISNNKIVDANQLITGINLTPDGLKTGVQLPLTNIVLNGNVIDNPKNGISLNDGADGYTPQAVTISNNVMSNVLARHIGGSATPVIADDFKFFGNNTGLEPYGIAWTSSLVGLFITDDGTNNWNLARNVYDPTGGFSQTWLAGQRIARLEPTVSGGFLLSGWVCTGSGNPGTWVVVKTPTP